MKLFYKWSTIRRLLKYTSPFTRLLSQPKIKKYALLPPKHEPIFILGAPRSGTTIIFQIITHYYDLLYPTNLVELSRENLYFGFWLNQLFSKNKPHNCFRSHYGITEDCGLFAPNEKGKFWWEWVPKGSLDRGQLDEFIRNEIKQTLYSVINRFNKPLIFKQLVLGIQIPAILEIFPQAKFILVKRDPLFTAQSLYREAQDVKIDIFKWVGVWPRGYEKLTGLPLHTKIVRLIHLIYTEVIENYKLISEQNKCVINYEDLQGDGERIYRKLQPVLKDVPLKADILSSNIKAANKQKTSADEFEKLKKEIELLDWHFLEEI